MGKHPNSDIHSRYSDWHWDLVGKDKKYKRLYVADIDRLWVEYSFEREAIVAIMDLKYSNGLMPDGVTATEKGIYDDFEKKGYRVYIVFIDSAFQCFQVTRYITGETKNFGSEGYADWLLSLRATR